MYDWILQAGFSPIVIATKADKIKRSKVSGQLKVIRQALNTPKGSILLPFSALDGSGREAVCAQILRLL
jgi:GTP-binding protein